MRLGVYIGSFNPPHKGHMDVVNYLLKKNYVDKVLIVPTLNYWDKQNLAPIQDRINMLKFYESNVIKIDMHNNQYIYTYELMQVLKQEYPKDILYLILGADNLLHFDKWKNYQKLLSEKIIIMRRDNIDIKSYLVKYPTNHFIVVDDYDYLPISSSIIRQNINSSYLDSAVRNYILKNHLYSSEEKGKKDETNN